MANIIEVFVKGDAHTPQRFWDYALRTKPKFGRELHELGFIFSQQNTDLYKRLSDEEKKKVRFTFIDGVRQRY